MNFIMQDLQAHLAKANVQVNNLSTLARKGDDKLVEKFLSESVFMRTPSGSKRELADNKAEVLESQLYIACFWGFRDIVKGIIELSRSQNIEINVNKQNKGTLWTPLHAATFQEHGPIVMYLLENDAQPELEDSEGRSPKDFASASDKLWGHFAMIGMARTPKPQLVEMGVIRKSELTAPQGSLGSTSNPRQSGQGIRMAAYSRPESAYEYANDPFVHAAVGGDVL